MKQLNTFKKKFDEELFSYLDKKERQMEKLDIKGGEMVKSIVTFLQYGGKRFRPALFYFAYESFVEKKSFDSLHFSFIFELFHTFALIHDDIIDHATLRRGKPTIHTKYGLHMGILSGDFALMLIDELYLHLISQLHFTHGQILEANCIFNAYKQELLVGQYLDCIHLNDREKIMKLKTADYSFVKPVLFALLFANKSDTVTKQYQTFLTRLGIIFQLKDDYEGIFSNEKLIGKSITSDIEEGKNTYIVELFQHQANKTELERFYSFFGKQRISKSDLMWYLKVLEEKGVKYNAALQIQTECKKLQLELEGKMWKKTSFHSLIHELIIYIGTF